METVKQLTFLTTKYITFLCLSKYTAFISNCNLQYWNKKFNWIVCFFVNISMSFCYILQTWINLIFFLILSDMSYIVEANAEVIWVNCFLFAYNISFFFFISYGIMRCHMLYVIILLLSERNITDIILQSIQITSFQWDEITIKKSKTNTKQKDLIWFDFGT